MFGSALVHARDRSANLANKALWCALVSKGTGLNLLARPFDAAAAQWPEALGKLRQAGPVHRIALPNGQEAWLVTSYAEVMAGLTDPRIANLPGSGLPDDHNLADDIMHGLTDGLLLMMHGPEHARIRRLIARAFTARRVEELRPRIRRHTDELLDGLVKRDEFDVMEDLAFPLTMHMLGELVGLPAEDMAAFRGWVVAYTNAVGAHVYPSAEITEFVEYLRGLVASKRENPDGALLSALIEVRDADDGRLSETELTSAVCLLIAAGFNTSVTAIGNIMYHLFSQPEEADLLRARPDTVAAVVERCLQLYPPVISSFVRIATEPVELGGVLIPPGAPVLFSLLSANHDSADFDGADFDKADGQCPVHKPAVQHIAFGHGPHYCLGASLARAEIQVVVSELLWRCPGLRLAVPITELTWAGGILTRGVARLPVWPDAAGEGRGLGAGSA
jgi:cytochrome P450